MIHGIQPGPLLIEKHPDLFWGVVASMYVGNMMLLVLNLPLVGMWVKILKVPYTILFPLIVLFCLIGVYSVNNSVFDIYVMILFGVIGYLMQKFGFEPAPLVLAYVLSPILETALRQSLNISGGSFAIFFSRPISLVCLLIVIGLLIFQISSFAKGRGSRGLQGAQKTEDV
jgi:putative tricarboxylic transport membrane protein